MLSSKAWITVDSSECKKSFELQSSALPQEKRINLFCFQGKFLKIFIFKLLFVVPLSVEQLSKVKMKDVLLKNFQY